MPLEPVGPSASFALAWRVDFLVAFVALEARRPRTLCIVALVDLRIRIAELDCDVSDELILKPDSLHAGDGLDNRGFAVSDMANCADVDGRLPRDNLRRQGRELAEVEIFRIRLRR